MRSTVGFFPYDPENLTAALDENFPLLLHRWRVDPVLRIAHFFAAGFCGGKYSGAACHGFAEHVLLGESIAAELSQAGAIKACEGLFDDYVLSQL